MNNSYIYEIHIEGMISDRWSDWFEGMKITHCTSSGTILTGRLSDQAAMLGVLAKIHSLHLKIVSVLRISLDAAPDAGGRR